MKMYPYQAPRSCADCKHSSTGLMDGEVYYYCNVLRLKRMCHISADQDRPKGCPIVVVQERR